MRLLQEARAALNDGKYTQAREQAERAVTRFRASSDAKNLAAALRVAGLAGLYSGSYAAAGRSLTEALSIARQLHDFGNEVARLNDLGMASYLQGRYREALDRYEEAEARVRAVPHDPWSPWARQVTTANIAILYQTLGQHDRALELYSRLLQSKEALQPSEQAQLLSNVGALRRRLGDPVRALETYRLAQDLYRRAKHADGEIAVLNNIGIVQAMDLGNAAGAEAAFSAAKELAERAGDRPLAIHAQLNRGEARYRAGRAGESLADFDAVSLRAHELGLKEEEWRALYGLARAGTRGATASRGLLTRAVELIESLRESAGTASLRSRFLADKRAVYDRLIESSTSPEEVFRWMEQSRARSLSEKLAPPRVASLREFQRSLPADTAVLEFWVGENSARTLWISQADVRVISWTPDFGAMAAARQALANPSRQDWRDSMNRLAGSLWAGLPLRSNEGLQRLRVIPDGPLSFLPLEALPLDESRLLVERFAVSYAPSATLSGHIKAPPPAVRWPWQTSLTGLGDPQPGTGPGDNRQWTALPHARTETRQVASLIGGRTSIYLGNEAQKEHLHESARSPILHLATHGEANPQNPDRSFLLLAPKVGSAQRFDYLYSQEVSTLPLAGADLVTLSACETNLGEFVPGEGLRAFAEAFLSAGARSVLSSLWSVGDVSTEELMVRFYTKLAVGEAADDALRLAKLEFIRHPQSSHPAHWAAFVLQGDSHWRLPRLIGWAWLGLAGALTGTLAWMIVRKLKTREAKASA